MTPLTTKTADPPRPEATAVVKRKRSRSVGSASESGSDSSSSDSGSDSDSASGDVDMPEQAQKAAPEPVAEPVKPTKPMCHAFVKSGRCKNGARCRFSHAVRGFLVASVSYY